MTWQVVCRSYRACDYNIGYCKQCGFHEADHEDRKQKKK